jgi:hypothetical protein
MEHALFGELLIPLFAVDTTLLRQYLRSLTPTHIGIIALVSLIFVSAASGFAFVMVKRQQQDGYYQLL